MDEYEHTHITWRKRDTDGSVSNLVHVVRGDRERAADTVQELMLNPDVFAVRAVEYPNGEPDADTEHITRIGPPITG